MGKEILPFEIKNDVRTVKGLGEIGERTRIVSWAEVLGHSEATCPYCGYDRVREVERVYPDLPSDVFRECSNCSLDVEKWLERREARRERDRTDRSREPYRQRDARRDSIRRRHIG